MSTVQEAPTRRAEKYVVLHRGLGEWRRGDVITRAQIEAKNGEVERLLGSRAMRSVTELEYTQSHVDLPDDQAQLSFQHELAQRDQTIARLTARVNELEEEKANRQQQVHAQVHRAEAEVFEEKDRLIHTLQAKLKNAEHANKEAAKTAPAKP